MPFISYGDTTNGANYFTFSVEQTYASIDGRDISYSFSMGTDPGTRGYGPSQWTSTNPLSYTLEVKNSSNNAKIFSKSGTVKSYNYDTDGSYLSICSGSFNCDPSVNQLVATLTLKGGTMFSNSTSESETIYLGTIEIPTHTVTVNHYAYDNGFNYSTGKNNRLLLDSIKYTVEMGALINPNDYDKYSLNGFSVSFYVDGNLSDYGEIHSVDSDMTVECCYFTIPGSIHVYSETDDEEYCSQLLRELGYDNNTVTDDFTVLDSLSLPPLDIGPGYDVHWNVSGVNISDDYGDISVLDFANNVEEFVEILKNRVSEYTVYLYCFSIEYSYYYSGNGGYTSDGDSGAPGGIVKYGDTFTLDSCMFTRPGYKFLDWNTKEDGTGISHEPGVEYTWTYSDMSAFYAQWEQISSLYIKDNDTFVNGIAWVKDNGAWHQGIAWVKKDGEWHTS